jgi:hypothetical protein
VANILSSVYHKTSLKTRFNGKNNEKIEKKVPLCNRREALLMFCKL